MKKETILIVILIVIIVAQNIYVKTTEIKGCKIHAIDSNSEVRYEYMTADNYLINIDSCSANCLDFNITAQRWNYGR